MIALPIPLIWKIPRERRQKIGILAAFLVAGIGTLASCIRLFSIKIFTESPQPMRDAAPISTWSFIEINLGILCASSAVIKPVFSKTRAPSLEKAEAQRLPRYTIGSGTPPYQRKMMMKKKNKKVTTKVSRTTTTSSRDTSKDSYCGRWSQSQASTAVPSPNNNKTFADPNHHSFEFGKVSSPVDDDERYNSKLLPDPPSPLSPLVIHPQKTPRGRQSQLLLESLPHQLVGDYQFQQQKQQQQQQQQLQQPMNTMNTNRNTNTTTTTTLHHAVIMASSTSSSPSSPPAAKSEKKKKKSNDDDSRRLSIHRTQTQLRRDFPQYFPPESSSSSSFPPPPPSRSGESSSSNSVRSGRGQPIAGW